MKDFFLTPLIWSMHSLARADSMESMSSLVGLPISSRILSTWLSVELPGNTGLPRNISPSMHPTDHISTALVYLEDPSSISGARYHLVATYSVRMGSPLMLHEATDLASPKSATLTKHSESRRMLDGLRSLWMRSPEWMYFMAFRILG